MDRAASPHLPADDGIAAVGADHQVRRQRAFATPSEGITDDHASDARAIVGKRLDGDAA